jgi:hypothetical protein
MNRRGFLVLVTGGLAAPVTRLSPAPALGAWSPATVGETWGLLRDVTALPGVTQGEVTGTWGGIRRIAGQHMLAPGGFGAPRSFS